MQCVIEKVLEMDTTTLWNVLTFQMREKIVTSVDFIKTKHVLIQGTNEFR